MLVLRLFSACGLLLSGYLLLQKITGKISYLVGCGAGSGCENVLGSKWSQWFYVPVTALSLLLYAALLALTFKPQRTLLAAIATSLAAAALWFGVVQAFILKSFCPWCLSAHIIGLICAGLVFSLIGRSAPRPEPAAVTPEPPAKAKGKAKAASSPEPAPPAATPPVLPGILAGVAAIAVLILGQVFGPAPATHLESDVVYKPDPLPAPAPPAAGKSGGTPAAAPTGPVHSRGEGRKVTFLVGKEYNIDTLPHLGDSKAPYVIVKYFDYACDACRDLHEDLNAFMEKYPGKFCVILLPCPINRACNPNVPSHLENHAHACELARLGLACWRTDPESFPAVHHALFGRPVMDAEKAMAAVKPLMKKPLAPDALADPWIDEILKADADDYKRVNVTNSGQLNYLMPKLLVGGTRMLHGVTQSRDVLFKALEHEFKLTTP
jgi:uncharacterized membrane protein